VRRALAAFAALLLSAAPAHAGGDAGQFDYWVLALTWSPQFCSQHEAEPQCLNADYSFVVHGLWPQNEEGYPDYCSHPKPLDHALVERMLPLIPGDKLIAYEWRKHGSCSGMEPEDYFLTVERARRAIALPEDYDSPPKFVQTSRAEIADKLIALNPGLSRDALALECSGRWLKEVRFCFDKSFKFRACSNDVTGNCGDTVVLRPVRHGLLR
jgi:ribonuclease T2